MLCFSWEFLGILRDSTTRLSNDFDERRHDELTMVQDLTALVLLTATFHAHRCIMIFSRVPDTIIHNNSHAVCRAQVPLLYSQHNELRLPTYQEQDLCLLRSPRSNPFHVFALLQLRQTQNESLESRKDIHSGENHEAYKKTYGPKSR